MTLWDGIKRCGEIVGAIVVVYGFIAGIIVACGGALPPWYSIAQAQTLEQSLKKFESDQDKRDRVTQDNIDLLLLSNLRSESAAADVKAEAHPHDAQAKADAWFTRQRLAIFFKAHPNLASAMGQ